MFIRAWLLFAALIPLAPAWAQSAARLTYLEGQVQLLRDTRVFAAVPGVALAETDIIVTAPGGYALLEFPDGVRLGLGADSRLMLRTLVPRGRDNRELALLQGWLKAQAALPADARDYRVATPTLALQWREASFILQAEAAGAAAFVESGGVRAQAIDRQGRAGAALEVRGGRSLGQGADRALAARERPAQTFVEAMPRPFRDPLPPLLARFGDRQIDARPLGEVDYAAVAPWLQGPQAWRGGLVARFTPRSRDAAFRQALVDNLKAHPEWERVLFPERFQPRPAQNTPPRPAAAAATPNQR